MESVPACKKPVEKARRAPKIGADDACLAESCANGDWLNALSHIGAIFSFENNEIKLLRANDRFVMARQDFLENSAARAGIAAEWSEQFRAFIQSNRPHRNFELRRDGKLGPEYFSCAFGRLTADDGQGEHYLFTAADRTNERTIEKNLRRELLSDGLTALPNRTGFGEEIDDRLTSRSTLAVSAGSMNRLARWRGTNCSSLWPSG